MNIECNYELPTLLRDFLGAEYIHISAQYTNIHFGETISANVLFPIRLRPQYFYFENRDPIIIELSSKGEESLAGDLYGITANAIERKDAEQTSKLYTSNLAFYGAVTKIVGLGEIKNEEFTVAGREEEVKYFFPQHVVFPDKIFIKKKTLEVIGFGLSSGKWLYLFSNGEGSFNISMNEILSPEELINQWETIDDIPKPLQVLQVFE